ncbi:alcohol dehydrogenase [Actinomyces viscosus]|uniref:Beta-ketoacyl-acyl-carrier-protein synthase I n=1 Tax=Actinomyces viscosus TaxID=1656 RepID=A0A3S4VCQ8_ACTVI|nr:zinc-binding dehydrogenase [Actinomyces viscosus]TFH53383.1 alcohol dehydrogenase [Actinomyces viscosus]VEI18632.1 Beta-ketoacyl-acyl-carrier-protein synthase I [Actinomyces viscosus]
MRAIVRTGASATSSHDGAAQAGPGTEISMEMREVPAPRPGPDEAVVEVVAVSLNFGSLAYGELARPGTVLGADGVGLLRHDPSGRLPTQTRVAFTSPHGTWAERSVVPCDSLAEVPPAVSDTDAAALPGAGLTALQAVDTLEAALDGLAGRSVLVTGAAGGVGGYAVQLAKRAGAAVTAVARSVERQEHARRLGADRAVGSVEAAEDAGAAGTAEAGTSGVGFDGVIDTVGGEALAAACRVVAPSALILNVGHASGQASLIDVEAMRRRAPGARIDAFVCTDVSGRALSRLLAMVAADELEANVGRTRPWGEYRQAVRELLGRRSVGKTVLTVSSPSPAAE